MCVRACVHVCVCACCVCVCVDGQCLSLTLPKYIVCIGYLIDVPIVDLVLAVVALSMSRKHTCLSRCLRQRRRVSIR